MTKCEFLAMTDRTMRKIMVKLPPLTMSTLYSHSRKIFLEMLSREQSPKPIPTHKDHAIRLWGIDFACGLFNAAGMFKHGEGYNTVASQGAGAYLAGTTTAVERSGNFRKGIWHPFMPYPKAGASSNWMGLPNEGHAKVARALARIEKQEYCPMGASIGAAPEHSGNEALIGVLDGLKLYDRANVDFIEINESCPNVVHEHSAETVGSLDKALVDRLEFISKKFLTIRTRKLPLIVKFSTDTDLSQVEEIVRLLISLGFDGVNFGNTSIDYQSARKFIPEDEHKHFDYFTREFGGGISGSPLRKRSLGLCAEAVRVIKTHTPEREFHIIRTGGIAGAADLRDSDKCGIQLNQWFAGYFDAFSWHGHKLYDRTLCMHC